VPDLAISATAYDFLMLGTRQEDPDTLFFSRRLLVEGDTELGLIAKNTLDAVELPKFSPADFLPDKVLARIFH
jgi:predicted lipid carrier protein YhbT